MYIYQHSHHPHEKLIWFDQLALGLPQFWTNLFYQKAFLIFHFSCGVDCINDPNLFCFYKQSALIRFEEKLLNWVNLVRFVERIPLILWFHSINFLKQTFFSFCSAMMTAFELILLFLILEIEAHGLKWLEDCANMSSCKIGRKKLKCIFFSFWT